jgi:hypothetical protein
MALMSAASSVASHMQQKAMANAANEAQSINYQQTTQLAKEGHLDVSGQAADKLNQEIEAANQKSGKLANDMAEYVAATTSAKDSVSGNTLLALIQDAYARKGEADAAITRQKEFSTMEYYGTSGLAGMKAKNRIAAAWKPPVESPSTLGLVVNTTLGAMSAYNAAKAADYSDLTINIG